MKPHNVYAGFMGILIGGVASIPLGRAMLPPHPSPFGDAATFWFVLACEIAGGVLAYALSAYATRDGRKGVSR